MAWVLVQHARGAANSANPSVALASAPTDGNLVVACLSTATVPASVTDPAGYTRRAAIGTVHTDIIVERVASTTSATVTFTAALALWEMTVMEFSGNAASGFEFDTVSAGASSVSATSILPGSITPAVPAELFVVIAGQVTNNGGSTAVGSGFTIVEATNVITVTGYRDTSTTQNPTCTWATAAACSAIMVAFKPPAPVVTGTLTTTLGALTGTLAGLTTHQGTLTTNLGALTGTLAGRDTTHHGTLVSIFGALTATLTGRDITHHGTLAATFGALTGTIAGFSFHDFHVSEPTHTEGPNGTTTVTGPNGSSTVTGNNAATQATGLVGSTSAQG